VLRCTSLPFEMGQCRSRGSSHHQHTALGDGEDTQAVLLFPRTAVVGGRKNKKNFFLPSSSDASS